MVVVRLGVTARFNADNSSSLLEVCDGFFFKVHSSRPSSNFLQLLQLLLLPFVRSGLSSVGDDSGRSFLCARTRTTEREAAQGGTKGGKREEEREEGRKERKGTKTTLARRQWASIAQEFAGSRSKFHVVLSVCLKAFSFYAVPSRYHQMRLCWLRTFFSISDHAFIPSLMFVAAAPSRKRRRKEEAKATVQTIR